MSCASPSSDTHDPSEPVLGVRAALLMMKPRGASLVTTFPSRVDSVAGEADAAFRIGCNACWAAWRLFPCAGFHHVCPMVSSLVPSALRRCPQPRN